MEQFQLWRGEPSPSFFAAVAEALSPDAERATELACTSRAVAFLGSADFNGLATRADANQFRAHTIGELLGGDADNVRVASFHPHELHPRSPAWIARQIENDFYAWTQRIPSVKGEATCDKQLLWAQEEMVRFATAGDCGVPIAVLDELEAGYVAHHVRVYGVTDAGGRLAKVESIRHGEVVEVFDACKHMPLHELRELGSPVMILRCSGSRQAGQASDISGAFAALRPI